MKNKLLCLLVAAVLLAGCTPAPSSQGTAGSTPPMPVQSTAPQSTAAEPCFFAQLEEQAIDEMALTGKENSFEKVRAAFLYVIKKTSFVEFNQPELTESWRYKDHCGVPPTIYQTMAMGPLLYGFGTCEHYSAALIVLLQHMGYNANYVPGLTYSVEGALVDHAWVMVEIEGNWYHIDPQLEDNVVRRKTIFYKYYLKSDEEFAAHHVWGSRLPNPDDYSLSLPPCLALVPSPAAEPIEQAPVPDIGSLIRQEAAAKAAAQVPESTLQPTGTLPPLPGEIAN